MKTVAPIEGREFITAMEKFGYVVPDDKWRETLLGVLMAMAQEINELKQAKKETA